MAAYTWWGLIPIYFKLVAHVAPFTVLAQRVVWSFLFFAALLTLRPQWAELRDIARNRRTMLMLAASTILLAGNWGAFIWAVARGAVLQTSLGYFMVPLVSVLLAIAVLKERQRPWQLVGLVLAAVGVGVITWARGGLPWVSLVMAISWGGYSLIRKIAHVSPLVGVTVETAMLLPFALVYITWPASGALSLGPRDWFLIAISGVVTGLPLLWFTAAARRLRLTTLGFLQYGAPIGQFLLAVFLYGEPFGRSNLIGFGFIWIALAVYSVDSVRAYRRAAPAEPQPEPDPALAEI